MEALKVGDRVLRRNLRGEIEYRGTVTELYSGRPNHVGVSEILYGVKWDFNYREVRGYLKLEKDNGQE